MLWSDVLSSPSRADSSILLWTFRLFFYLEDGLVSIFPQR